jgi:hypothetical protein
MNEKSVPLPIASSAAAAMNEQVLVAWTATVRVLPPHDLATPDHSTLFRAGPLAVDSSSCDSLCVGLILVIILLCSLLVGAFVIHRRLAKLNQMNVQSPPSPFLFLPHGP